ncbi:MAG TPA: hypothetical protein VNU68_26375 [Verrucomicrobiae bacterium]|nr:hypothetical protein [Verrucomicrobiae bacterium]
MDPETDPRRSAEKMVRLGEARSDDPFRVLTGQVHIEQAIAMEMSELAPGAKEPGSAKPVHPQSNAWPWQNLSLDSLHRS